MKLFCIAMCTVWCKKVHYALKHNKNHSSSKYLTANVWIGRHIGITLTIYVYQRRLNVDANVHMSDVHGTVRSLFQALR